MFLKKDDSLVLCVHIKIPKTRNDFRNELYQDWGGRGGNSYSILQIRSKTQPRGLFVVKVGIKI